MSGVLIMYHSLKTPASALNKALNLVWLKHIEIKPVTLHIFEVNPEAYQSNRITLFSVPLMVLKVKGIRGIFWVS